MEDEQKKSSQGNTSKPVRGLLFFFFDPGESDAFWLLGSVGLCLETILRARDPKLNSWKGNYLENSVMFT